MMPFGPTRRRRRLPGGLVLFGDPRHRLANRARRDGGRWRREHLEASVPDSYLSAATKDLALQKTAARLGFRAHNHEDGQTMGASDVRVKEPARDARRHVPGSLLRTFRSRKLMRDAKMSSQSVVPNVRCTWHRRGHAQSELGIREVALALKRAWGGRVGGSIVVGALGIAAAALVSACSSGTSSDGPTCVRNRAARLPGPGSLVELARFPETYPVTGGSPQNNNLTIGGRTLFAVAYAFGAGAAGLDGFGWSRRCAHVGRCVRLIGAADPNVTSQWSTDSFWASGDGIPAAGGD